MEFYEIGRKELVHVVANSWRKVFRVLGGKFVSKWRVWGENAFYLGCYFSIFSAQGIRNGLWSLYFWREINSVEIGGERKQNPGSIERGKKSSPKAPKEEKFITQHTRELKHNSCAWNISLWIFSSSCSCKFFLSHSLTPKAPFSPPLPYAGKKSSFFHVLFLLQFSFGALFFCSWAVGLLGW